MQKQLKLTKDENKQLKDDLSELEKDSGNYAAQLQKQQLAVEKRLKDSQEQLLLAT